MSEESNPTAVLSFDFQSCFPHKFWISDWSPAEDGADQFRYKIMSGRRAGRDAIQLVIVLERGDGTKEIMQDLDVRPEGFDRVASVFVSGLADEYGLDFEEQDFSECRTFDDFDSAEGVTDGQVVSREIGLFRSPKLIPEPRCRFVVRNAG